MDINTSIIGGEIDKSQVPPIDQKRILAFVNHFILNTCTFLNDFAFKCENRFIDVERKLQKVEASLIIIEEKLLSIPGLDDQPKLTENSSDNNIEDKKPTADQNIEPVIENLSGSEVNQTVENENNVEESKGVQAYLDVRYKKFFKMVQFGVPPAAVKLKMKSEGLDPEILDTPKLVLSDGFSVESMES